MKTTLRSLFFAILLCGTLTTVAQNPMCMIGDATKYGWDKDKSSPMTQDGVNPSKFYYKAWLNAGGFKFLMQNSDWVPSWNKGASESEVLKRNTSSDLDNSFSVGVAGNYTVVLDTTSLTLSVTPMIETTPIPFNTVFIVGDASPNGWDLGRATELVKNPTNPNEFSYTGALAVGDFKFPVNRNWGWNQDFFMKVSDTQMVLQSSPDVKWSIAQAANYKVTINTNTLAISILNQTTTVVYPVNQEIPSIESNVVSNELKVLNAGTFNFQVYNLAGATLLKGKCTNGVINVSNLNKGIYMLNVDNKAFKFIKE